MPTPYFSHTLVSGQHVTDAEVSVHWLTTYHGLDSSEDVTVSIWSHARLTLGAPAHDALYCQVDKSFTYLGGNGDVFMLFGQTSFVTTHCNIGFCQSLEMQGHGGAVQRPELGAR